jgi:hypothetical protein
MSGRYRADDAVRVKGSNPSWLDRDREGAGRITQAETKVKRHWAGKAPEWAGKEEGASDEEEEDAGGAGVVYNGAQDAEKVRAVGSCTR